MKIELAGEDLGGKKKNKKTGVIVGLIRYERCHPDSNWRMMVLQTIALPLGYGTKKMER